MLTAPNTAWANSGLHGDPSCVHDNGTYNSSACFYGVVQTSVATGVSAGIGQVVSGWTGLHGGILTNATDQLRKRTGDYGGVNQFVEAGFEDFWPVGAAQPVFETYVLYVQPGGHQVWLANGSQMVQTCAQFDTFDLTVDYISTGTWGLLVQDQNPNSGSSCSEFLPSTGNIGIYGGAIAETGSVFVPGSTGSFNDGATMFTFNAPNTVIHLNSGQNRSWSTYVIDAACPGAPCMNGGFYSGMNSWSSNKAA